MSETTPAMPSLDELGRDLLTVPRWRKAASLIAPFVFVGLFFVLASQGEWIAAAACPVMLSFLTYGSISHDLVHRNLAIPRWLNELLLSAIEMTAFRSGHAYRVVHLNHHAHFPADDDLEGAASKMSFIGSLIEGLTLQPRLVLFALRRPGPHRRWIVAECTIVGLMFIAAVAVFPTTPAPLVYAALMIGGSWIFPFITSWIPHDATGTTDLTQTKLFRGRVLAWAAMEHLYHLEHHLYPIVPHHKWPELAARLDPYFERAGIRPIKLLF